MNRVRLLALAGLSFLAVQTAYGQTSVSAQVTSKKAPGDPVGVNEGGFDMSPFTGEINGTAYRLNCVDFFHDAVVGDLYDAWQTNLLDLATTPALLAFTRAGTNLNYAPPPGAANAYKKAAYLSSLVPTVPSSDALKTAAIQTAIWAILGNYLPFIDYTAAVPGTPWFGVVGIDGGAHTTQHWIDDAAASGLTQGDAFYKEWYVVTDKTSIPGVPGDPSHQELMYRIASTTAPEPASIALMATGLIAVGGMVRRRRSMN